MRPLHRRMPSTVGLKEVNVGNPFKDYPQLRTIWPSSYSERAEGDTVRCLERPEGRKVFLIEGEDGSVVGITGYYFFDDDEALGLRWHGVVPCFHRHWYSKIAMQLLCAQAKVDHPERTGLIELMPIEAIGNLDKPFRRHSFVEFGKPAEYHWLMAGFWQAYRRELPDSKDAQWLLLTGYQRRLYGNAAKHDWRTYGTTRRYT